MSTLQTLRTLIANDSTLTISVEVYKPVEDDGLPTESFGLKGGMFILLSKSVSYDDSGIARSALRRHGYGSIGFIGSVSMGIAIPNDPSRVAGLRHSENRRAWSWHQWNNLDVAELDAAFAWLDDAARGAEKRNFERVEFYRKLPVNVAAMKEINRQNANLAAFPTEMVDDYLIEKMGYTEEQFENWGPRTRRERRKEARKEARKVMAQEKAATA